MKAFLFMQSFYPKIKLDFEIIFRYYIYCISLSFVDNACKQLFFQAVVKYHESIASQSEWKQFHHLCYWELMWCYW